MTEQPTLYRATTAARINGVACEVKVVMQLQGDGEIAGCVGLPDLCGEPLCGFVIEGDAVRFIDLLGDDALLAKTFGISAVDVRGALCRLAVEMLLGPDVREITPAQVQAPPTAHTLH